LKELRHIRDDTNPTGDPMTLKELRPLIKLALPISLVQVGIMTMHTVDTMMVGRVPVEPDAALAAVALGGLYSFISMGFGMGILMALDPIISQAYGAKDRVGISRAVQRGFVMGALLTVPCALFLVPVEPILVFLKQPEPVIPIATRYVWALIPSVPAFFIFMVLRRSLQAMARLTPLVITIVLANVANVFFNWVLVFGNLGFPEMGAVGSGWATTASRCLMALSLLILTWPTFRPLVLPIRPEIFEIQPLTRMFRLGLPIGTQLLLEMGAFSAIGLLMGWLGAREMAGHQIALNLAALTFMVPLGFSSAVSVRVGHAIGRVDMPSARRASWTGLTCGIAFMTGTAVLFVSVPDILSGLYTPDPAVLAVALVLIPIAGVFQIFDGTQIVLLGILRGLGDTRTPMIVGALGFWLFGFPISLILAFQVGAGPVGLWWGLVAGLGAVALFLFIRARSMLARTISRVVIDDESKPRPETEALPGAVEAEDRRAGQ
jgi:MATE family multidrug resistance protein